MCLTLGILPIDALFVINPSNLLLEWDGVEHAGKDSKALCSPPHSQAPNINLKEMIAVFQYGQNDTCNARACYGQGGGRFWGWVVFYL